MFLSLQKQVTYHILHVTQLTGRPEDWLTNIKW